MLRRVKAAAPVLVVLLACAGAGCTDRERAEARLLVDRASAIDPRAGVDERRRQVDALERLGLESEGARVVRAQCVTAHRKLLEAEDATARANEVVGQAERGEAPLTSERASEVGRSIQRSNDALVEAADMLPQCQARVAELASRHGLRP
jgi:hypothetical protein